MRKLLIVAVLASGVSAIGAGLAKAERVEELESARANARAGGPLSERDRELLERYGALSGTPGYDKAGLRRLPAKETKPHKRRFD